MSIVQGTTVERRRRLSVYTERQRLRDAAYMAIQFKERMQIVRPTRVAILCSMEDDANPKTRGCGFFI
jgi:hypothetical protein